MSCQTARPNLRHVLAEDQKIVRGELEREAPEVDEAQSWQPSEGDTVEMRFKRPDSCSEGGTTEWWEGEVTAVSLQDQLINIYFPVEDWNEIGVSFTDPDLRCPEADSDSEEETCTVPLMQPSAAAAAAPAAAAAGPAFPAGCTQAQREMVEDNPDGLCGRFGLVETPDNTWKCSGKDFFCSEREWREQRNVDDRKRTTTAVLGGLAKYPLYYGKGKGSAQPHSDFKATLAQRVVTTFPLVREGEWWLDVSCGGGTRQLVAACCGKR